MDTSNTSKPAKAGKSKNASTDTREKPIEDLAARGPAEEETISELIKTQAANLDEQIKALSDKKDVLAESDSTQSESIRRLTENQTTAINNEITALSKKKDSILAILENLPEEFNSLEARAFAALKLIF